MADRTVTVIEAAEPDIIAGEGGKFYFWPTDNKGAWEAEDLRIIAAYLDSLNGLSEGPVNSGPVLGGTECHH